MAASRTTDTESTTKTADEPAADETTETVATSEVIAELTGVRYVQPHFVDVGDGTYVNPDHVAAIVGLDDHSILHLAGGSSRAVGRPAAEIVELLTAE
jgi:hypothetical protein